MEVAGAGREKVVVAPDTVHVFSLPTCYYITLKGLREREREISYTSPEPKYAERLNCKGETNARCSKILGPSQGRVFHEVNTKYFPAKINTGSQNRLQ